MPETKKKARRVYENQASAPIEQIQLIETRANLAETAEQAGPDGKHTPRKARPGDAELIEKLISFIKSI